MVASRSLLRPRPNLRYTPRERPVSAQRLRWRAGRGIARQLLQLDRRFHLLFVATPSWLLTIFFSASRLAAYFFDELRALDLAVDH